MAGLAAGACTPSPDLQPEVPPPPAEATAPAGGGDSLRVLEQRIERLERDQ